MTIHKSWAKFITDTRGEAGFVEWFIIVACVALFCIVAFQNLGTSITTEAGKLGTDITTIAP